MESPELTLRFEIREFDELSSTNNLVKQAMKDGEPEGLVVCAKTQTAGYGRRGHKWESGEGSLYMSMLLRPDVSESRAATLPLATALAVRRAIAAFLPAEAAGEVRVKWPNDVVYGDASPRGFGKMCGISTEWKLGAVCVGIGVNVRRTTLGTSRRTARLDASSPRTNSGKTSPSGFLGSFGYKSPSSLRREAPYDEEQSAGPDTLAPTRRRLELTRAKPARVDFSAPLAFNSARGVRPHASEYAEGDARNLPTYISDIVGEGECPAVSQVRDAVLREFAHVYDEWLARGFAALRDEYMGCFALLGAEARIDDAAVLDADGSVAAGVLPRCVIEGVTDQGMLVVLPHGDDLSKEVASGTVTISHFPTNRQGANHD